MKWLRRIREWEDHAWLLLCVWQTITRCEDLV
jgi:hypothetical protein